MQYSKHLFLLFYLLTHIATAQASQDLDNFVLLNGGTFFFQEANVGKTIPVTLSSFYISPTEVTYEEMEKFAIANAEYAQKAGRTLKPEDFTYNTWGAADARQAAINVNWFDAIRYANWLSAERSQEKVYTIYSKNGNLLQPTDALYWDDEAWHYVNFNRAAKGYRLPTEVEWEYAASGYENLGYSQKYAGCDTKDQLGEYAWYYDNAGNRVHQVATRKPNTHGLYDMSGNVMEWCWDEYSNNIESFAGRKDPYNLGFSKRIRAEKIHASDAFLPSGSWGSFELFCEVSCRHNFVTSYDNYFVGFRLVRTR